MACGTIHTLCATADGDAYSWGVDAGGRLGHGPGRRAEPLPRRIDAFGMMPQSWRTPLLLYASFGDGRRVVEVAAAREHSLFKLANGKWLGCGKNEDGRVGVAVRPQELDSSVRLPWPCGDEYSDFNPPEIL